MLAKYLDLWVFLSNLESPVQQNLFDGIYRPVKSKQILKFLPNCAKPLHFRLWITISWWELYP